MPYKMPDLEFLIKKKMDVQQFRKILTTKVGEHIPCGCSMSTYGLLII